jgi:hypothetical protein
MLTTELMQRQQGTVTVAGEQKTPDPFVFSPQMVRDLELLAFAGQVIRAAHRWRPGQRALPALRGGRPVTYRDENVLVTLLVMMVWQVSPETLVKRMQRWPELAEACGYAPGPVISASQLRRRREQLGLWVYFITFCALVWVLIGRGVLTGRDWVIDSTLIDAFSARDAQAGWSFTKRFGYKVHMLICRDSLLPIMFLVSPANRNDAPWAVPLMLLALLLFRLPVRVVRADAAYFTRPILAFITGVLRATPLVVYNPRKRGKKAPVTQCWAAEDRRNRGKRGYIERFFAVLKRYFRLNHLQAQGAHAAYRHAFEVCLAVLLVAWLADSLGRPDLLHARSRLLAPC